MNYNMENIYVQDLQSSSITKFKYSAVIIEVKKHNALSFVLQNFLDNLTDEWLFIIFHGNDNKEYIQDILLDLNFTKDIFKIKLVNLNVNIGDCNNNTNNNYDYIWKNKGVYDYIPTDTFLIFKTNSVILNENKHLIYDYLNYDYVGAPWTDEVVGNGGLSLRKKNKMIEIIDKCEFSEKNEDEFFCRQNSVAINHPSFEKSKQFSVETVFYHSPFGIHNCYKTDYLNLLDLNFLLKKYPIIKELRDLNTTNPQNSVNKLFTVVYKTYRNDLEWLKYSLESLQKYLNTDNIFELVIYTHDVVYTEVYNLLNDINMGFYINFRIIPINYNYHGYIKQMVVKANCYKDCRTKYIILLDSDLILQKKLDCKSLIKSNGQIEWFYLKKQFDPSNPVFTVWKKAFEDSAHVPQNIHYMSNGFPFIFTKQSLENAANKFIELNGCDYDNYCGNRCYAEKINVEDRITNIFNKLSKVWTEFEYLGFYCHNYSDDYIFTPTKICRMKNQFRNTTTDSYFVQYWSHDNLDETLKQNISLNNRKKRTVIHVFTQSINNLKTDDVNNFWGLGDIIRGTIALFQLSKKYDFRLIVDIQLHPISNYLKYNTHEYSEYIRKNKDNISFIYPDTVENYIKNSNQDTLYFLTNDYYHDEITDECKEFIKDLLTPNLEFGNYIQNIINLKPPPEKYSILHFRLGDSFLVRNDENSTDFKKIDKIMHKNIEACDIFVSDSSVYKKHIGCINPNAFLYDIKIGHIGIKTHSDYIKDTLFEFFLVTRSSRIKTFSVYGHISGFVKIVHEIYDIPLFLLPKL